MNAISGVIETLLRSGAIRTTKYLSEKQVVRATLRQSKGARKTDNIEIMLTLGRPNYDERAFVKACKKAGEPFPVKKIQFKFKKAKKK